MTTLVMIPGMMCDARLFAPQSELFSPDFEVIIPDLKGHNTISGFAEEILDHAPASFSLLGLSMGGIIAMEIMRLAKTRIERVALLDTNPLAEKEEIKQRRISQIIAVKEGRLADIMRDEMKPNYLADGPEKQSILDLCMDMAQNLGANVFEGQSHALMDRSDQTQTLKNTDIPALILCGREDQLCPIERHELMHDLMPGSQLEIIENAGHMPVLEQADITNEKIKNWLKT